MLMLITYVDNLVEMNGKSLKTSSHTNNSL